VQLVHLASMEPPELLALQDLSDPLAQLEEMVPMVLTEPLVQLEHLASMEPPELLDLLDPPVPQDLPDLSDLLAQTERQDQTELQALQVVLVLTEQLVLLDPSDLQDLLVQLVPLVSMEQLV